MIDYLADCVANECNIKVDDIQKVAIPARLEALTNNQIDAVILLAPFDDKAIADGGKEITKIYNKDIMISTTAFLQEFIDSNPEEVGIFYKAYNKAIDFINNNNIKEYEDIVIKTVGYSEDMKGNLELPDFKTNYLPSEERVQAVLDWSKEQGIIEKDLKASDLMNDIGIN